MALDEYGNTPEDIAKQNDALAAQNAPAAPPAPSVLSPDQQQAGVEAYANDLAKPPSLPPAQPGEIGPPSPSPTMSNPAAASPVAGVPAKDNIYAPTLKGLA